jgi:hypothetical protein
MVVEVEGEEEQRHPYALFQAIKGGVHHKKQRVAGECVRL